MSDKYNLQVPAPQNDFKYCLQLVSSLHTNNSFINGRQTQFLCIAAIKAIFYPDILHRFCFSYLFFCSSERDFNFSHEEGFTAQPPPNSPPDLDLLQVHSELGVSSSFHVISGTLPVMATPNAGLCSSTGQRIHECFISCCARMFVYQRSSLIPTKLDFFLFHRPSETIHTL